MLDRSPPQAMLGYVAHYALMSELSEYTGFGPEDHALLKELGPHLEPHFDGIVDAFYHAIEANPEARAVFADEAQIARQKTFLRRWMTGIFSGVYDEAYFERRARIGRAHVRIQLEQRYMISAMNVVRVGLHDALNDALGQDASFAGRLETAHDAIDRICDLELAIMLETYREDYDARTRSAEKLAALGQLAATIGHELRNPLAVMETSIHLLAPKLESDPKAKRHIARLGEQVALCSSIIENLLELARDRPVERGAVAIDDLVASTLESVEGGRDVTVVPTGGAIVQVDPGQIRQLLLNLTTNAIHAARSGAKGVRVELAKDGRDLFLRVTDDGKGVPEEVMPRLFEPLFTTRARGVGLGLALCRRVSEKHGGTIQAQNLPEGGARFEVFLPQAISEVP